jgi:hypothetical protein
MSEEREYPDSTAEAKEKAEASGLFDVIVADDFTLLLDLDSAADLSHWQNCWGRIEQYGIKIVEHEQWFSKSNNTHVRIKMESPLPIRQRIGLEAVLGSDRKRASIAYREATSETEYAFPCMLFRPKGVNA